jgi:hypothetical protein
MKKILIAAVAATSLAAGIGAAQADGTDPQETYLFRDRGAIIISPEDPYAPVPYSAQPRQYSQQGQFFLFAPFGGNSSER